MSARLVVGIFAFCLALAGIVVANVFQVMMIREVNRRKQRRDLISYFGFTPFKSLGILEEYRDLYPRGRLHIFSFVAFGVFRLLAVAAAGRLGP